MRLSERRESGAVRAEAGRLAGRVQGADFSGAADYMLGDARTIEPGIDLILMSRHLERVGNDATNIAEDVIFIVEARDVRHGSGVSIAQAADAAIHARSSNGESPPAPRRSESTATFGHGSRNG